MEMLAHFCRRQKDKLYYGDNVMGKIKSINHIAFAVKDFDAALENAIQVLGGEMMMEFESIEDRYKGACVRFGDSIMSFISSDDPESFISKHVEKYGNSIQHIGLEIDNIEELSLIHI